MNEGIEFIEPYEDSHVLGNGDTLSPEDMRSALAEHYAIMHLTRATAVVAPFEGQHHFGMALVPSPTGPSPNRHGAFGYEMYFGKLVGTPSKLEPYVTYAVSSHDASGGRGPTIVMEDEQGTRVLKADDPESGHYAIAYELLSKVLTSEEFSAVQERAKKIAEARQNNSIRARLRRAAKAAGDVIMSGLKPPEKVD